MCSRKRVALVLGGLARSVVRAAWIHNRKREQVCHSFVLICSPPATPTLFLPRLSFTISAISSQWMLTPASSPSRPASTLQRTICGSYATRYAKQPERRKKNLGLHVHSFLYCVAQGDTSGRIHCCSRTRSCYAVWRYPWSIL